MDAERRYELLRAATELLNRGSAESQSADVLHRQLEIVPLRAALEGTVYRGPDAFREFIDAVHEEWSSLSVTVERMEAVGDGVLGELSMHMVARASGMAMDVPVFAAAQFRDGRICRIRTDLSREAALAELTGAE